MIQDLEGQTAVPLLQPPWWAHVSQVSQSSKNELGLGETDGAWGIGHLVALKFGFSWEQPFIVLAVCFINVGTLRDLAVCFDDGVGRFLLRICGLALRTACSSVAPGLGMCQIECQIEYYGRRWEDVLHAVLRPGSDGVADGVRLFCLCMMRCLVHPVDFIVDVLIQSTLFQSFLLSTV